MLNIKILNSSVINLELKYCGFLNCRNKNIKHIKKNQIAICIVAITSWIHTTGKE